MWYREEKSNILLAHAVHQPCSSKAYYIKLEVFHRHVQNVIYISHEPPSTIYKTNPSVRLHGSPCYKTITVIVTNTKYLNMIYFLVNDSFTSIENSSEHLVMCYISLNAINASCIRPFSYTVLYVTE
jgi:hypothetical protein